MKRGPDWNDGNSDGDPPSPGIVVAYSAPSGTLIKNIAVCWESGKIHTYVYNPQGPKFEVQFVSAAQKTTLRRIPPAALLALDPSLQKKKESDGFRIGDLVRSSQPSFGIGTQI